ncbi:Sua5 family C-terminal domain-containing protein [Planomonospora parontospora]|nr:Sua5 family C-terminal domain-containing protein [Planomonospora parontospora]
MTSTSLPGIREFDQRGRNPIAVSLPVEEGLGPAIADRLRRAAGPRPAE